MVDRNHLGALYKVLITNTDPPPKKKKGKKEKGWERRKEKRVKLGKGEERKGTSNHAVIL